MQRIVGVDVARCLALLGMMATHILPGVVEGRVTLTQQVAAGRASALFAMLAGVSLVFVAGSRSPLRGRVWRAMQVGTAARAVLLAVVGLLLGSLDANIAVILVYYAMLFVVAVPFMALPTRALAVVTGLWVALAPPLSQWLRDPLPRTSYAVPSLVSLDHPVVLVRDLLLTGYYPVLTWVPYILVGLLIGRTDLTTDRTAGLLATVGGTAAALSWLVSDALLAQPHVRADLVRTFTGAGWQGDLGTTLAHGVYGVTPTGSPWWLAVRAPHTGTTFDVLMTAGSAALVLAGCLVVGRRAPRVCSVVFGAAFRWGGHRGPLEVLAGALSSAARRPLAGTR